MLATIMIAEDEVALRELLSLSLRANGFDTLSASNTNEALRYLRSHRVDLVLLDLGLGRESGIDLLRLIRRLPNAGRIPVILLTGCNNRETVLQAAQFSAQGYVLKSQFSLDGLIARIKQQLSSAELSPPPVGNTSPVECSAQDPLLATKPPVVIESGAEISGRRSTDDAAALENQAPPADLLRILKPIITRDQILEQVDRCQDLKALSPTVAQVMKMTARPDCSLTEIARVIKQDQAVSLKVLKLANSVVYSRGEPVDSVQKAISRIGVAQIRQVVLNVAVIDSFQPSGIGKHLNAEWFWEHSIATGLIAAAITRACRGDERAIDNAFTAGLLHDVGRMIFAQYLEAPYKRVLETAMQLRLPLEQIESRMLVINHADLMERVLGAWKFPQALIDPIALHHQSSGIIRNLLPQKVGEVCTLALADRLAHALLLGSSGNECQYPTEEFFEALDLTPETIKFIEEHIIDQTVDMKYAMLQSGEMPQSSDYRQTILKQFKKPFQPLYVSDSSPVDGYRILFNRMKGSDADQSPNIAVMNLAKARSREALFKELHETEEQRGMGPLPLIVISPANNLKLSPHILGARRYRIVPSPFVLSRFSDAVNELTASAS